MPLDESTFIRQTYLDWAVRIVREDLCQDIQSRWQ
jgi:hypothetical protein